MKRGPISSKVPNTILGIKLVLNKCFLDEFTAELAFLVKEAGFISHSLLFFPR